MICFKPVSYIKSVLSFTAFEVCFFFQNFLCFRDVLTFLESLLELDIKIFVLVYIFKTFFYKIATRVCFYFRPFLNITLFSVCWIKLLFGRSVCSFLCLISFSQGLSKVICFCVQVNTHFYKNKHSFLGHRNCFFITV